MQFVISSYKWTISFPHLDNLNKTLRTQKIQVRSGLKCQKPKPDQNTYKTYLDSHKFMTRLKVVDCFLIMNGLNFWPFLKYTEGSRLMRLLGLEKNFCWSSKNLSKKPESQNFCIPFKNVRFQGQTVYKHKQNSFWKFWKISVMKFVVMKFASGENPL